MDYSLYCDESCHLLNDDSNFMVLGCIWVPTNKVKEIHNRIRDIKRNHNIKVNDEIKWTKISPGNKSLYHQLVDYYFDDDDINFRAIIIDKRELHHENYSQTHEDWYYKMLFCLLHTIFDSSNRYQIFLDYKDSQSGERCRKLHDVLCSEKFDFSHRIITNVQCLPSKDIGLIQLCDIIIGALSYNARGLNTNDGKLDIINVIKQRTKKGLSISTLPSDKKFNLFFWHSRGTN